MIVQKYSSESSADTIPPSKFRKGRTEDCGIPIVDFVSGVEG